MNRGMRTRQAGERFRLTLPRGCAREHAAHWGRDTVCIRFPTKKRNNRRPRRNDGRRYSKISWELGRDWLLLLPTPPSPEG